MKVLLCQDVKNLGWLGDVVEVNEGYARNYLLPQGLALVSAEPPITTRERLYRRAGAGKAATEGNVKSIAQEKARRAEQRLRERNWLVEQARAVDGAEAVIAAKANEQGVLFGSVTDRQIAANLREQGFKVADEVVQLPEHIKHVGTHTVKLDFGDDLTAEIKLTVVPQVDEIITTDFAD